MTMTTMTSTTDGRRVPRRADFKVELLVIFALLISLGFPGNLTKVFGAKLGTVLEYSTFVLEILAMLLSTGSNWLEIQFVNLKAPYRPLYFFGALIFVQSMLASADKTGQFITCARLFVTILFCIWLQEQFDFEHMLELICTSYALFTIATVAFTIFYPRLAFDSSRGYNNAYIGLYFTKNSNASVLLLGILLTAFLIRRKRSRLESFGGWMMIVLVQSILLLLCQATGPLLSAVLLLLLLFVPSDLRLPIGWLYLSISVIFLFSALTLLPMFSWLFEAFGKDATLTGRVPLWNGIIDMMSNNRTMIGYGYGMFWRDSRAVALLHSRFNQYSFMGNMTSGAHNMLLEFWLNGGLIGLGTLFMSILLSTRSIHEVSEDHYSLSFIILAYLTLNGLTERCLGGNYDYKTVMLFLSLALCCNRPIQPSAPPIRFDDI